MQHLERVQATHSISTIDANRPDALESLHNAHWISQKLLSRALRPHGRNASWSSTSQLRRAGFYVAATWEPHALSALQRLAEPCLVFQTLTPFVASSLAIRLLRFRLISQDASRLLPQQVIACLQYALNVSRSGRENPDQALLGTNVGHQVLIELACGSQLPFGKTIFL